MEGKKRILLFIDWYYPAFKAGGPISSVRNLCLQLKKEFELLVVTSDRDLGDTVPLDGVETNKIVKVEGISVIYLAPNHITAKRFMQIKNDFKPDVIHLNSLFSAKFTILPLKTFKGDSAKMVISPRGMFGKESLKIKPLKKKLFFTYAKATSLFKGVIWHGTSDLEKDEIVLKMGQRAQVVVANNVPFLPEEPSSPPIKEFWKLRLLAIGRLAPIKNFDFLLTTLRHIKSDVRLTIVGPEEDAEYNNKCRQLANELESNIEVKFLGGLSPAKIAELYASHHLFITASKNENFGHSIAEALGFGRPIIVSDKTPWKNLEQDGIGFDLPLKEENFIESIDYFASLDQDDYNKFCEKARKKAVEIANPDQILTNYKALYEL